MPVPRVLGYAEVETRDKPCEAWLVMSRLDGRPLWPEMLAADRPRRARLWQRLGALLQQLHNTPVPVSLQSDAGWIDRMLAQARENLAWCDGTAERLADLHRRRPAPVAEVLIHGDLALDNVLVTEEDGLSLIDWPGGGPGDPLRHDIALALDTTPEFELGDSGLEAFFEGYGGAAVDLATREWFVDLYHFF